jgi:hypothetical protein
MINGKILGAALATQLLFASVAFAETGAKGIFEGKETESAGPQASATSQEQKKDQQRAAKPKPTQMALRASVKLLDKTGGVLEVPPSHTFRSGERIRLHFRTNKPGYLYVANIGTTGKIMMLHPHSGQSNQVNPGLSYEVPDKSGKAIRFDQNPGIEEVLVVLSPEPLEKLNVGSGREVATNSSPTAIPKPGTAPQMHTVLAMAEGAKDLQIEEEDAGAIYVADKPAPSNQPIEKKMQKPIILKLKLKHV